MRTYADQLREDGEKIGKDEGMALGEARGLRSSLERIREARFGTIPAQVQEVLASADLDSLNDWIDVALHAETLEEVGIRPCS